MKTVFILLCISFVGCSFQTGSLFVAESEYTALQVDKPTDITIPLTLQWEFEASGALYTPVPYGNFLICGDKSGRIYIINGKSGDKEYELKLKGILTSKPLLLNANVLIYPVYDEAKVTTSLFSYHLQKKKDSLITKIPLIISSLIPLDSSSFVAVSAKHIVSVRPDFIRIEDLPELGSKRFVVHLGKLICLTSTGNLYKFDKEYQPIKINSPKLRDIYVTSECVYLLPRVPGNSFVQPLPFPFIVLQSDGGDQILINNDTMITCSTAPELVIRYGGLKIHYSKTDSYTSPVFFRNGIVAGTSLGKLIALDYQGVLLDEISVENRISESLLVYGSSLYVVTQNGNLYSYK